IWDFRFIKPLHFLALRDKGSVAAKASVVRLTLLELNLQPQIPFKEGGTGEAGGWSGENLQNCKFYDRSLII
ncbi:MAG: hypothetical protein IJS60_05990, partial [Abditibacteriota bacterium]|nr:hypothetical protein [Abditibacteriota bacterium]